MRGDCTNSHISHLNLFVCIPEWHFLYRIGENSQWLWKKLHVSEMIMGWRLSNGMAFRMRIWVLHMQKLIFGDHVARVCLVRAHYGPESGRVTGVKKWIVAVMFVCLPVGKWAVWDLILIPIQHSTQVTHTWSDILFRTESECIINEITLERLAVRGGERRGR